MTYLGRRSLKVSFEDTAVALSRSLKFLECLLAFQSISASAVVVSVQSAQVLFPFGIGEDLNRRDFLGVFFILG